MQMSLNTVFRGGRVNVSSTDPTPVFNGKTGKGIQIKASPTNTGAIYLGGTDVDSDFKGYPMLAGDSVFLPMNDCSQLRALAEVDGERLHYFIL